MKKKKKTPKPSQPPPRSYDDEDDDESSSMILNEPEAAYLPSPYSPAFINPLHNIHRFINMARKGITKSEIMELCEKIGLTFEETATLLEVSPRTLHRYPISKKLGPPASERALMLKAVVDKGLDVFESLDLLKAWLHHPNPLFEHLTPISLFDTSFGLQLLLDELIRIEHGVFA
jgi:putative toxin-antitoxin system antitoxin component (TIGR02293 family)